MSGLAKLLAGNVPPGVYRWTSASDAPTVQHAVERAGWRFVGLDTWRAEEKSSFLQSCKEAFGLGDLEEHDFDGLADALGDVRAEDSAGVVVVWDGWAPFARADPLAFEVAVDVFDARVDDDRGGPFAVLLKGPGPETDVPELDPRHSG